MDGREVWTWGWGKEYDFPERDGRWEGRGNTTILYI